MGVLYINANEKLAGDLGGVSQFLKIVAVGLVTIFLTGIGVISLPIVAAQFNLSLAKLSSGNQLASENNSANVYSGNFVIADHEKYNFEDFSISIPKIGVESKVTADIDPNSEEAYKSELYKNGVAHAKGSYLPGQNGPVFLFSHSTDTIFNIPRFNAKFFGLKDLNVGDEIDIAYNGKDYKYKISSKKIIDPTDLDTIRQTQSNLILSTCWPPGTDWQRLIIFADLVT